MGEKNYNLINGIINELFLIADSTRALYKRKLIALRSKPGNKHNVPSTTVSHISTKSKPCLSPTQGRESPPDETIPVTHVFDSKHVIPNN